MNPPSFALTGYDGQVVFVLFLTTISFIAFWFVAESLSLKDKIHQRFSPRQAVIRYVLFQKYAGVFFLGLVPFVLSLLFLPYSLKEYGLGFQNTLSSFLWIIGLASIILPLNIRAAKRPQNMAMYPMIRAKVWDRQLIATNALATILYLLSYELLFRGILLHVCVVTLGVWPAVAINVALYAAVHLPKGPAETIGALPFGVLICYITLTTGTIWVAVVVHIILSLSNDYLAVHYNPEMHYKKS